MTTAADPERVGRALQDAGYAVVRDLDVDGYRALARALGPLVREDRVAIEEGARAYVARPNAVPFHNDHPQVETIAWRCERQDDLDGASLVLDARPVLARLDAADRRALRETILVVRLRIKGATAERWPVLRDSPRGELLFFAPWLEAISSAPDAPALERLRAAFAETPPIARVRLAPGEAIFVDNQRLLHGRDAIAPNSERHLHRLWIGSRDAPAE
jgi:hypothetical protein